MTKTQIHTAPRARRAALLLSVAATLGVAGCAGPTSSVRYDRVYPISVEVAPQMLELPAEAALSSFDASRIDAFGREFLRTGDGELTIAYPGDAQAGPIVAAASERLKQVGVPAGRLLRGPYSREADGDRGVVLSFYAPAAVSAKCAEHPGDPTRDVKNATPAVFGCAYQQNLAAMMEEPRDAVAPRPATPPSADRRAAVLGAYVEGKPTWAETQTTTTTTDE